MLQGMNHMMKYSMTNKKKHSFVKVTSLVLITYVLKIHNSKNIFTLITLKKSHADIKEKSQSFLYRFHTVLLSYL